MSNDKSTSADKSRRWTTRYYKNGIGICRPIPGQPGLYEYKLRPSGEPVLYKRGLYAAQMAAKLNAQEDAQ